MINALFALSAGCSLSSRKKDFRRAIDQEHVLAFDIRAMPDNLTDWELGKKLIIVCKKEDDNLTALSDNLLQVYPQLAQRKTLIIDDEADFASVGYRRTGGIVTAAVIPVQIDTLRQQLADVAFLQVTATPYSLYLQPDGDIEVPPNGLFLPVRPAFTELVPLHGAYIGGEYYFEQSQVPGSVASYLHIEVSDTEMEVLKDQNPAIFDIDESLTSPAIESLRRSIMTFVVGAWIRRWQQQRDQAPPLRYSFIVHTETTKTAHGWQAQVVTRIIDELRQAAQSGEQAVDDLLAVAHADLAFSLQAAELTFPSQAEVRAGIADALNAVMTTTVNSERQIDELLDESGQLQLRTPYNIFIGGQILDRGLTIDNLIGFFYGRRPKRAQQDTVLQHSRMYGNRSQADLAVTRFYTTQSIYSSMAMIHDFDTALRTAIEAGGQNAGVIFLRADQNGRLVPCAPTKTLLSSINSVRPNSRLQIPAGFTTHDPTDAATLMDELDAAIGLHVAGGETPSPVMVSIDVAEAIIDRIAALLEFRPESPWEVRTFKAALRHLATANTNPAEQGQVVLLVRRNRELPRIRTDGRYQTAVDSRVEIDAVAAASQHAPALLLYRQNGTTGDGWRGIPFWWPLIRTPRVARAVVFASEEQA
jgi:Z1 domain-containing protein